MDYEFKDHILWIFGTRADICCELIVDIEEKRMNGYFCTEFLYIASALFFTSLFDDIPNLSYES